MPEFHKYSYSPLFHRCGTQARTASWLRHPLLQMAGVWSRVLDESSNVCHHRIKVLKLSSCLWSPHFKNWLSPNDHLACSQPYQKNNIPHWHFCSWLSTHLTAPWSWHPPWPEASCRPKAIRAEVWGLAAWIQAPYTHRTQKLPRYQSRGRLFNALKSIMAWMAFG